MVIKTKTPGLTQEQNTKVREWLNEKIGSKLRPCVLCGTNKWTLQSHLVATPIFTDGIHIGGETYPYAVLTCNHCGNSHFLNTVKMGVTPRASEVSDE
jgi:predicted nucleic-acid-binding Zn-ribbon protein